MTKTVAQQMQAALDSEYRPNDPRYIEITPQTLRRWITEIAREREREWERAYEDGYEWGRQDKRPYVPRSQRK